MSAEWWDAIGSMTGGLAALGAIGIAQRQLAQINRSLKHTSFAILLQLETEMNERKLKVDEATVELRKRIIALPVEDPQRTLELRLTDVASDHLEGCVENWLNAVDRFAFCILKKYLKEAHYKPEYKRFFQKLLDDHPERFQPGTIYENILKIAARWQLTLPPRL